MPKLQPRYRAVRGTFLRYNIQTFYNISQNDQVNIDRNRTIRRKQKH